MKLKVCGLTQPEEIKQLTVVGVDYLGFIFYSKSPRSVLDKMTPAQISAIKHSGKVGVFVNENIKNITTISAEASLNYIQLHGDETIEFLSQLRAELDQDVEIIKVIRIANQTSSELQDIINHYSSHTDYFLFDTDSAAFGGTGKTFEWKVINELSVPKPYFLSGGISLENQHDVKNLNPQPYALDINSKFEIKPGCKNIDKIKTMYERL